MSCYQPYQPKDLLPQTEDSFLSCASDADASFSSLLDDSASRKVVVEITSPILIDEMQTEKTIHFASLPKSSSPSLPQTSTNNISSGEY